MPGIHFHYQDTDFKLPNPRLSSKWLVVVAGKEKADLHSLDYIFCSDQFLLRINMDYLQHDELTDVITFDYAEPGSRSRLEGEVYISIDRVRDNATTYKTEFETELHRVMVHGLLHLLGYNDKSPSDTLKMRGKEEAYLSLR